MVEVNEEPNDANLMVSRTALHQDNEIGEEQVAPPRHRNAQ